jgi:hypothetical protein
MERAVQRKYKGGNGARPIHQQPEHRETQCGAALGGAAYGERVELAVW